MNSTAGLASADNDCCGAATSSEIHGGLANLLRRYDINDYAASVSVYALKAR